MIPWVERKTIDWDFVAEVLEESRVSGVWTNFGPASRRLEGEARVAIDLPEDRAFVATASGTAALHALVSLQEFLAGRRLRWLVAAYTFPCQRQGPLSDARVLDVGRDGHLCPGEVEDLPVQDYDGIVVTNLLGGSADIERWEEVARQRGKVLLFDSAMGFGCTHRGVPLGRFGDGECFSFHHTKPLGFGEGGGATVPRKQEDALRSILNFGRYAGVDTGLHSMNGKLSDPAAALILDRLRSGTRLSATHRRNWHRIVRVAERVGMRPLVVPEKESLPPCAWLSLRSAVVHTSFSNLPFAVGRYYAPLEDGATTATGLYQRSVCIPTHPGMEMLGDDALLRALEELSQAQSRSSGV